MSVFVAVVQALARGEYRVLNAKQKHCCTQEVREASHLLPMLRLTMSESEAGKYTDAVHSAVLQPVCAHRQPHILRAWRPFAHHQLIGSGAP